MNLDTTNLEVFYANVHLCAEDEYAVLRKNTIGASDFGTLIGVGMDSAESLLTRKQAKYVTEEERAIGLKPNVRKGKELEEPIIRPKAAVALNLQLYKPLDMYRMKSHPFVTINYDAIAEINERQIPVELKYVSTFATKFWEKPDPVEKPVRKDNEVPALPVVVDFIRYFAYVHKIPPYYYPQIQIQLRGLNAPYGYIAALYEKDWDIHLRKIPADVHMQNWLLHYGEQFYAFMNDKTPIKARVEEVSAVLKAVENFEY